METMVKGVNWELIKGRDEVKRRRKEYFKELLNVFNDRQEDVEYLS